MGTALNPRRAIRSVAVVRRTARPDVREEAREVFMSWRILDWKFTRLHTASWVVVTRYFSHELGQKSSEFPAQADASGAHLNLVDGTGGKGGECRFEDCVRRGFVVPCSCDE